MQKKQAKTETKILENAEKISEKLPDDKEIHNKKNFQVHQELAVLEERDKKIEELTELLKRLQADFENYQKQVEKQNSHSAKFVKKDIMLKMLPIIDSFHQAIKNKTDKEEFIKGVELIYSQLNNFLEAINVKPIEAIGKKFDPHLHEALMHGESEEDNIILEEIQKGYMIDDAILRHTKVKVSKKKEAEEKKEN